MAGFRKAKSGWLNRRLPFSGDSPTCHMTCPVCGKAQPCVHSRRNTAVALDAEVLLSSQDAESSADQLYWRQEIAARVRQHRARRRRRYDADASLELNFPAQEEEAVADQSQQQIASGTAAVLPPARVEADGPARAGDRFYRRAVSPPEPPKIIRFPQSAVPPTTPAVRPLVDELELADPAPESPRILDAPEAQQLDLLPAFTDIQLDEPAPEREALDLPPQPAPLHQRVLASLMDGAIVLAGVAVFAACFAKMSAASMTSIQARATMLGAAAVGGILWLLFEYVFLVYGEGTPGMRSAGLEVCDFAGERPPFSARRNRALAMMLSALSLGLGFAWALVDEDTLGWHDRISGTYIRSIRHLAVSTQQSALSQTERPSFSATKERLRATRHP